MNTSKQAGVFQSVLANYMDEFLVTKRALGKRFVCEAKVLRLLDRYLVDRQVRTLPAINPGLIETFLISRPRSSAKSYNHLLGVTRRFFEWLVLHKVILNSPVRTQPRRTSAYKTPFIFNASQSRDLLEAAAQLPSRPTAPDRGTVYRMVYSLLYALGLRVGEVTRLQIRDVDYQRKLLVIRQTKFSKTRLVPFGPRLGSVLDNYLQGQTECYGKLAAEQPLFSFCRREARPICPNTISWAFRQLILELALTIPPGVSSPHLHCLRHSFAVGTLLRWYRAGIDPSSRLLHLSTFMGHVSPSSTAVYLTITIELLQSANERFEHFTAPLLAENKL